MTEQPETAGKAGLVCAKCDVALEPSSVKFSYLDREMQADVPRCPVCGQVYLSEELVTGKIHQVEASLEDK